MRKATQTSKSILLDKLALLMCITLINIPFLSHGSQILPSKAVCCLTLCVVHGMMPGWQWKLHRLGHSLDVLWKLAVIKPPQEMNFVAAIDIIPAVEKAHIRGS